MSHQEFLSDRPTGRTGIVHSSSGNCDAVNRTKSGLGKPLALAAMAHARQAKLLREDSRTSGSCAGRPLPPSSRAGTTLGTLWQAVASCPERRG